MKLKNKLILIFILFTSFVIFNNSSCFASDITVTYNNHEYTLSDVDAVLSEKNLDGYPFIIVHCKEMTRYIKNTFLLYVPGRNGIDLSRKMYVKCYAKNGSVVSFNTFYEDGSQVSSSEANYLWYYYGNQWVYEDSTFKTIYFDESIADNCFVYSTLDVYDIDGNIILSGVSNEPTTTKHDIFQLNLTDKNFNNSQHTFTLNTDENSVNYSEITDLIENNNKYCIYVTDYTRLLTFSDNSFYATLEGGSYLLSGYIDFLVSDNAYFYFSPHYNRIKVCSGDYRGHDMTTYTKRYFFNLVYSDDSDDAYFTILDDNGMLWALSDYVNDGTTGQSEKISDFKNTYFIGSNQTIYYAQEDSNYILDSLTDSIYYGKNRGEDTHVYNFAFSGGNTKEFYLSKATFDDDVSTHNNSIIEKSPVIVTEETQSQETPPVAPPVIYDTSDGQSSVIPQDETTYTYPQNTVTDETSSEDDLAHVEPERVPYTSTDTNDDTSNWSLWDFIKGIFEKIGNVLEGIGNLVTDLISGLISLFVPSSDFFGNVFTDLNDWFEIKLGFIFYPFQFFMNFFDRLLNIEFTEPIISIPDIKEPFSDEILIHAVEFNFNSLLEDERINTAHNYYLMFVDVILIIGFINLLKNKFEEVTNK